jgi:hypothetical protein
MSTPTTSRTLDALQRELTSLVRRVADFSPQRWASTAGEITGHDVDRAGSKSDAVYRLVVELARLSREAGSGAPAGAVPARVADLGLADQLATLAQELLDAPEAGFVADSALEAVQATRAAVEDLPRQLRLP